MIQRIINKTKFWITVIGYVAGIVVTIDLLFHEVTVLHIFWIVAVILSALLNRIKNK